jgi:hypothetical protein
VRAARTRGNQRKTATTRSPGIVAAAPLTKPKGEVRYFWLSSGGRPR